MEEFIRRAAIGVFGIPRECRRPLRLTFFGGLGGAFAAIGLIGQWTAAQIVSADGSDQFNFPLMRAVLPVEEAVNFVAELLAALPNRSDQVQLMGPTAGKIPGVAFVH